MSEIEQNQLLYRELSIIAGNKLKLIEQRNELKGSVDVEISEYEELNSKGEVVAKYTLTSEINLYAYERVVDFLKYNLDGDIVKRGCFNRV